MELRTLLKKRDEAAMTASRWGGARDFSGAAPWPFSLFAALADPQAGLFGQNFDWTSSLALLAKHYQRPPRRLIRRT